MDTRFLMDAPKGDGILELKDREDNTILKLYRLPNDLIWQNIPRLRHSLDVDAFCQDKTHTFKGQSKAAVVCLFRWAINGDYTHCESLVDKPASLLLHLQVYALARKLEVTKLSQQARREISIELESSCSSNRKLIDLTASIRFIYLILPIDEEETQSLREQVAHSLLSLWHYHKYSDSYEIRQCIRQCPRFAKDLAAANLRTNFAQPGATDLVSLDVCTNRDHEQGDRRFDFACDYHDHPDSLVDYIVSLRKQWLEPTEACTPARTLNGDEGQRHISGVEPQSTLPSLQLPLRPREPIASVTVHALPGHRSSEGSQRTTTNSIGLNTSTSDQNVRPHPMSSTPAATRSRIPMRPAPPRPDPPTYSFDLSYRGRDHQDSDRVWASAYSTLWWQAPLSRDNQTGNMTIDQEMPRFEGLGDGANTERLRTFEPPTDSWGSRIDNESQHSAPFNFSTTSPYLWSAAEERIDLDHELDQFVARYGDPVSDRSARTITPRSAVPTRPERQDMSLFQQPLSESNSSQDDEISLPSVPTFSPGHHVVSNQTPFRPRHNSAGRSPPSRRSHVVRLPSSDASRAHPYGRIQSRAGQADTLLEAARNWRAAGRTDTRGLGSSGPSSGRSRVVIQTSQRPSVGTSQNTTTTSNGRRTQSGSSPLNHRTQPDDGDFLPFEMDTTPVMVSNDLQQGWHTVASAPARASQEVSDVGSDSGEELILTDGSPGDMDVDDFEHLSDATTLTPIGADADRSPDNSDAQTLASDSDWTVV